MHGEGGAPSAPRGAGGEVPYLMLLWELPPGLPLEKPEAKTGPWEYPPSAKLERLLRASKVSIGLLTNRQDFRLIYAPPGESSGAITFRLEDMATVGGRPILDAFVMLLSANRFFGVAPEHQLPALLRQSRLRQANVTNELADQVFEALSLLLAGFEAANARDERRFLEKAFSREGEPIYGGLLTVLLRLVFLLYAEDRGLMPMESSFYAEHLSVLGLFDQLQKDFGQNPDTMGQRFGAWPRLLALFRAIYLGLRHGDLYLPPRRGELFDPQRYPFLEGWEPAGGAPINQAEDRAKVRVPPLDDGTVYRVLQKLLLLEGQWLSYRALDVEQIGSVYEALMGYSVERVGAASLCLKPARVWVSASEILEKTPAQRGSWLAETCELPKNIATKLGAALKSATTEAEVLEILEPQRQRGTAQVRAGAFVIQPGSERRRTSSHYTPRSLSEPIVRRTLEPLLLAMGQNPSLNSGLGERSGPKPAASAPSGAPDAGPAALSSPSSELLLNLKVCDPAMGSGAFLVEACRFLADQVIAAWTREGKIEPGSGGTEEVTNRARRLVAQRCLYGVDKNPFAVSLAKLSLWLVTLAKDEPFTFLDHALRHGDSLVGLSLDQIKSFHWKPVAQLELCQRELDQALGEAIGIRQQILALAGDKSGPITKEKEWLLRDSEDALDRVRLLGDLVVGAFFSGKTDKEREKERVRRLDLVLAWLRDGGPAPDSLRELQRDIHARLPVFHWMVEFPEVFYGERPDPLDGNRIHADAWMDAFVGNPPFMGGWQISGTFGETYRDWLLQLHEGAHGNSDLSAHFFRRADTLLGKHGTTGLIATNTIGQGDTRNTGLKKIVDSGNKIYDATSTMLWPGEAKVAFSVVHVAKGHLTSLPDLHPRLDGDSVTAISSQLKARPERSDPSRLAANSGLSFLGTKIYGEGFALTPDQKNRLIESNPKNEACIFPYLGGEEVNSSPTQEFERYVINFWEMTLDEASQWPELLDIVKEKVKPERDKNNREAYKIYWWHFGEKRPGLYGSIKSLKRCLVNSQVSKHLMFAWQPVGRVFSHKLCVYAFEDNARFAVLQSQVHEFWARSLSSSFGSWPWPVLSYAPSDCFETFPFPPAEKLTPTGALEKIGEQLYTTRAKYMVDTNQGLTATYNQLKDPACHEPRVVELRRLHEEMDRAVLAAYGWEDIQVPPYGTPTTPAEEKALEVFADEVIDRLFELNAKRAEEEKRLGLSAKKGAKKPAAKAKKETEAQIGFSTLVELTPKNSRTNKKS